MGCAASKDATDASKKPVAGSDTIKAGSHLTKPEEITAFPEFPAGTKSLLSKHLTKKIFDELKDKKDKHGYTFREAIFSGVKNTDSGIGVYAGSHDSYTAFASLFDKIVEDYHTHPKKAKHVSDMDASKLNAPPFNEADSKMIISTRIRVGRNLEEFPLGPGVSKEQRD